MSLKSTTAWLHSSSSVPSSAWFRWPLWHEEPSPLIKHLLMGHYLCFTLFNRPNTHISWLPETYLPDTRWQEWGCDTWINQLLPLHKGKGGDSRNNLIIETPRSKGVIFFFFFPLKEVLGHCEITGLVETVLIKWMLASHSHERIYGRPQQFSTYWLKMHSEANHTAAWELCRGYWINQVLWTMKHCKTGKKKKKRNQMRREKVKRACSLNCP